MRIGTMLLVTGLAGCATTTQIVPAGQDTYMVSAANDTCGNCTPPEIRATQQASEYCTKLGRTMVVKDTKNQTFDIGFGKRYTLTFACVPPAASK
jgi:hypothetical protein